MKYPLTKQIAIATSLFLAAGMVMIIPSSYNKGGDVAEVREDLEEIVASRPASQKGKVPTFGKETIVAQEDEQGETRLGATWTERIALKNNRRSNRSYTKENLLSFFFSDEEDDIRW